MACQHFPDDQTLRLQAGAGEDDIIHLPSGLDRVAFERQEEEDSQERCTPFMAESQRTLKREWPDKSSPSMVLVTSQSGCGCDS